MFQRLQMVALNQFLKVMGEQTEGRDGKERTNPDYRLY